MECDGRDSGVAERQVGTPPEWGDADLQMWVEGMSSLRWLTSADVFLAVERLAERLSIEVRTGAVSPGCELTIREVAEHHRVSFEVADAALARLVCDGVLARAGRSVLAPPLDGQELHRIFRTRRQLEPDFMVTGIRRYTGSSQLRV